ncbi:MAG: AsmA family protein [Kiloniellaceae bacterium]
MKKVLIGLAAAVVLTLVVLIAAPFLIPVETYKEQIAEVAREATGRELSLKGGLELSVLPRLELQAEDVAFANAPGAATARMASLDKLVLRLQVWPLLSGEVRVDSFVLVKPVIHLEVDKAGRPNWDFGAGAKPAGEGTAAPGLQQLSLGDVRIEDGLITFRDARTGDRFEASDITMKVSLPDLDGPVRADGSLVWNGRKLTLKVESENLRGLMAGKTTPLRLALESEPIKVAYRGSVTYAAPPRVDGQIDLDVPSIRALAAWAGNPVEAAGGGLGPLKITGKIDATDKTFAFTGARIALDRMNAAGDITADIGGKRPYLKGRLDVDRIDANVYLPPPAEDAGAPAAAPGAQGAPAGWSEEPIALDGLKAADVDFALTVGSIRVRDLKIGRSAVTVALKDGLLVLDLTEFELYGGRGKGRVTLDARGKVPAVAKTFAIEGVQAEPLLSDAAGVDRLAGTGRIEFSMTARGRSQKAMVAALDGTGAVKFTDGAIKGINLAAMARNVGSAFLDAGAATAQKTDFAELSGTFKIEKGILRNDDLVLLNPLLRLNGKGTADMPKRTLNYRVEPKVVASLQGQGGTAGAKGLAVPVIVEGPWDDLSYRPDLAGLATDVAKDPSKALQGAKETVKRLKEGADVGKVLEGIAKPPAPGGDQGGGLIPDPKKALKKLFGN